MLLTLRYAVRSIRSAPLASAVVVLCIGLSIGATTTVFAWTDHLVRRPLPAVAAVDRVVSVATRAQGSQQSVSYPDYLDWRDQSQSIPALAAFGFGQFALRASGDDGSRAAESVWGLLVTDNYFDVLGVSPIVGRAFAPRRVARREGGAAGRHQPSAVGAALRRRRRPRSAGTSGSTASTSRSSAWLRPISAGRLPASRSTSGSRSRCIPC